MLRLQRLVGAVDGTAGPAGFRRFIAPGGGTAGFIRFRRFLGLTHGEQGPYTGDEQHNNESCGAAAQTAGRFGRLGLTVLGLMVLRQPIKRRLRLRRRGCRIRRRLRHRRRIRGYRPGCRAVRGLRRRRRGDRRRRKRGRGNRRCRRINAGAAFPAELGCFLKLRAAAAAEFCHHCPLTGRYRL